MALGTLYGYVPFGFDDRYFSPAFTALEVAAQIQPEVHYGSPLSAASRPTAW